MRTAAASLALPLPPAFAQAKPVVRLIVAYTPGTSIDVIGRLVAEAMARRSGQTWICENKPGAGSQLGTDVVAKAVPDGTKLLLGATAGIGVLLVIKAAMPYSVDRDLT